MVKIAVIPGDGIGPEVVNEGIKVLEKTGINAEYDFFNLGAEHYLKTGELLGDELIEELKEYDAIYLGAVGDPRVKPGVLEQGILLKLRFSLDLYVNLRPIKLLHSDFTPLKNTEADDIDFTIIRENTEGLYSGSGGFLHQNTPHEVAIQEMVNTYRGVERIIDYAFTQAQKKGQKVTLCDKANVLTYAHDLWQRVFEQKKKEYPGIETDHYYVDAITMKMVRDPGLFNLIVTCNMFGDIITDLGAELQGGMGMAASGNINPQGMAVFEPVHGSAPDIAGEKISNPVAAIVALSMMLKHLGYHDQGIKIENAIKDCLLKGKLPLETGGNLKTEEMGAAIRDRMN